MLKFYFNGSPNPTKVALFLEEAGIAYEPVAVDTRAGEQFNPNISPSIQTARCLRSSTAARVFDSNAILLYLAEKTGKFLPSNTPQDRGEMLSWLMFVATGVGPYSGQAVHFKHFAPKDRNTTIPTTATNSRPSVTTGWSTSPRQQAVHGRGHLQHRRHGVWGWARMAVFVMGDEAPRNIPTSSGWWTRSRHVPRPPRRSR